MLPSVLAVAMVSWSCLADHPVRATRELALNASAEGVSKLEVRNRLGAIRVNGYDGSDVQVQVTIKVRTGSDERATALAEKVEVRLDKDAETLKLSPHLPKTRHREQIQVELDISVPWHRTAGEAAPSATRPEIVCHSAVGQVKIRNVDAAIRADVDVGTVDITNVAGPVTVGSGTGGVRLRQVADYVTVTAGVGGVSVAEVRGTVRVKAAVGKVDIRDVRPAADQASVTAVEVESSVGSVTIQDVTGDVEAVTNTGSVTIKSVRGRANARSSVGKVTVGEVEDPPDED